MDDSGGEPVASDQYHRVEMVGVGALFLALMGCEGDGGHPPIIGAA